MPKEIANTYIEYENMLDSYAFVWYNKRRAFIQLV